MIVYYILCPSLRVVIFREEQGLSTFYMRCDVRKSVACFITFPNLLFVALLSLLTGARSWLRLSKVSNSTSLPLVSPRSNHSTVTLRVSMLMPETTAEWMRPEIMAKNPFQWNAISVPHFLSIAFIECTNLFFSIFTPPFLTKNSQF